MAFVIKHLNYETALTRKHIKQVFHQQLKVYEHYIHRNIGALRLAYPYMVHPGLVLNLQSGCYDKYVKGNCQWYIQN